MSQNWLGCAAMKVAPLPISLARWMHTHELTQREVADLCGLGQRTICRVLEVGFCSAITARAIIEATEREPAPMRAGREGVVTLGTLIDGAAAA